MSEIEIYFQFYPKSQKCDIRIARRIGVEKSIFSIRFDDSNNDVDIYGLSFSSSLFSRYSFNAIALLNFSSFVPYNKVIDPSFTLSSIVLTDSLFFLVL
jgi:hypothetical protein